MEKLYKYIDKCIERKSINIFLLSEEHFLLAKKYLQENNIVITNIIIEKNVEVCCRLFPEPGCYCNSGWLELNCEHLTFECMCDKQIPVEKHYSNFSWSNQYMEHYNNCYDDTCHRSNIFNLYTIQPFYKI